MRSFAVLKLLLLVLALALGTGCSFGVGSDYAVTVTWLINGSAPSKTLCESQGVDRIRFTVLAPGKERSLYADCDAQVTLDDGLPYGGFVTTASFAYGTQYRYRVEMVDANGKTIEDEDGYSASYEDTFEVYPEDDQPWVLTPLDLGRNFGSGSDYAVTVTWLINGTAPSKALCESQGVDRVRFTMLGPGKARSLYADCDAQVTLSDNLPYGGFVTSPSFEYGTVYRYRVEMVDANGKTIEDESFTASYSDKFQVYPKDEQPWVLTPLELFSPDGDLAGISAEWTIGGQKASANACQKIGAVAVAVDFASSTDVDFEDAFEMLNVDCADGIAFSDGAVLDEGEYNVRYVALDADGNVVQEIAATQLYVVDVRGTLDIESVDFDL